MTELERAALINALKTVADINKTAYEKLKRTVDLYPGITSIAPLDETYTAFFENIERLAGTVDYIDHATDENFRVVQQPWKAPER